MSRRTLTVDEALHDYAIEYGVREHPELAALRDDARIDLALLPIGDRLTLARKR